VLAAGQKRVERGLLEGGPDHLAHLRPLLRDVEPVAEIERALSAAQITDTALLAAIERYACSDEPAQ
jgi:hypothetical protein